MQELIVNLKKELQTLAKVCTESAHMTNEEFATQFPTATMLLQIPEGMLENPAVMEMIKNMQG